MRTKLSVIAGLALLEACGPGTVIDDQAQAQTNKATMRRPLDLAGVTIDMSASEAQAALQRGGWQVERLSGETWERHVANEIARQHRGSTVTGSTPAEGDVSATKGDEHIQVTIRPSPRGGAIEWVNYSAPFAGRSQEEIAKSLDARYGKPTTGSGSPSGMYVKWCDPVGGCKSGKRFLTADTGGSEYRLRMTLFWGDDDHAAWDRTVGQAVAAKGGPAKSSF